MAGERKGRREGTDLSRWLALEERILARKQAGRMMSKAKRAATLVKRAYGADVYLFGSLARGRTHARSDVDLLVCGVFSESRKREVFREIERVVMPYPADVLFEDEVSEQFRRAVKERGVKLTC
jgi:predicted nucleotidyltransferase